MQRPPRAADMGAGNVTETPHQRFGTRAGTSSPSRPDFTPNSSSPVDLRLFEASIENANAITVSIVSRRENMLILTHARRPVPQRLTTPVVSRLAVTGQRSRRRLKRSYACFTRTTSGGTGSWRIHLVSEKLAGTSKIAGSIGPVDRHVVSRLSTD